jgi:hypothetical protein
MKKNISAEICEIKLHKFFNFNSFDYNSYGYSASAKHRFYKFDGLEKLEPSSNFDIVYYYEYICCLIQNYMAKLVHFFFQSHILHKFSVILSSFVNKIFSINVIIFLYLTLVFFKDVKRNLFFLKFLMFSIYQKVKEFLKIDSLTQLH